MKTPSQRASERRRRRGAAAALSLFAVTRAQTRRRGGCHSNSADSHLLRESHPQHITRQGSQRALAHKHHCQFPVHAAAGQRQCICTNCHQQSNAAKARLVEPLDYQTLRPFCLHNEYSYHSTSSIRQSRQSGSASGRSACRDQPSQLRCFDARRCAHRKHVVCVRNTSIL